MDQTPTKEDKRVVIVIKMPDSLIERIMAFPAIHLIRDAYPEADIHFICSEYKIELLYALPFEGFWHSWNHEEIKSVLDVHRFVTQLTIPQVDIFISFSGTLNDLSLGTFLAAKKKVGFAEGWKRWFTTFPLKRPMGYHLSDDFLFLYREFTNRRIPEDLKVKSREMLNYYTEEEKPFLAIDLSPFPLGGIDSFWVDFISLYDNKRFVFFFSEDEAKGALLTDRFIEKLPTTNRYDLFLKPNLIDQGKMLAQAKGTITRHPFTASYTTYLGTDVIVIYETGEPRRDAPIPFYANWQIMDLRDPTLTRSDNAQKESVVRAKPSVSPQALYTQTQQMFYF